MMKHATTHARRFQSESPVRRAARRAVMEALEDRRLLSAGQPDPTFGAGGLDVLNPTLVSGGVANAVAIQADGKIVSAGDGYLDLSSDVDAFALVRYNRDGSTDTSFGANGVVHTVLPGSQWSVANDVAIQADGKIVAAGFAQYSGNTRFAAVRYLPSGKLDTTFSGDGIATMDFGPGDDRAASVAIDPGTGKIVLGGTAHGGGTASDMAVVRFNPDGTPDTTFNGTGRRTIDFAGGQDAGAGVLVGGGRPHRHRRLSGHLRARPPHPIGIARHHLRRRRQAHPGL